MKDHLLAHSGQLVDSFGRSHHSLRISVTDRCNIRCQYCMSDGPLRFLPRDRLLTFEQITTFVSIVAPLGVRKIRLTGGEPLVRNELFRLVGALKKVDGVEQIALTTNGMLLAEQIEALAESGLDRINISLDTLREQTFKTLSRREGLDRVVQGIEAAINYGYAPRLNALVLRDINFDEVSELAKFAVDRGLTLRFIEFMPLDADRQWGRDRMVSGQELREVLQQRFGKLRPKAAVSPSQPATDYYFGNAGGVVGFIDSVSQPFCGNCDRIRLTAEGKIRNCLFGREEWDVKAILDQVVDFKDMSAQVQRLVQASVAAKYASHGIADDGFVPPERAMYQIGG